MHHPPPPDPAAKPNSTAQWYLACQLDELAARAREVLIAGRVIALFHTADGIFAVDGMCAHQGGPIAKGTLDGCCVTCPWHGWQYDVRSGHNVLTGRQMLTTYPVQQRGEEVWIAIE